jgi:hypothetical protein
MSMILVKERYTQFSYSCGRFVFVNKFGKSKQNLILEFRPKTAAQIFFNPMSESNFLILKGKQSITIS